MSDTPKKFTLEEFYRAIITLFTGEEVPADAILPTDEEIVEFARAQYNQIQSAKTNRAAKRAATIAEPDELKELIYAVVAAADEPIPASEVVIALNNEEYSMAKVSNRLSSLAKEGRLYGARKSIRNDAGRAVKRIVYSASPIPEEE